MFSSNNSQVSNDAVFVEDIFSTYLYTGTGAAQSIVNGIDESGEGALTWIKNRSTASEHALFDTNRGVNKALQTQSTAAEFSYAGMLTAFNSNGFSLGTDGIGFVNVSGDNYASWTFRKQPKFFDVVTYTGNGTTQNIAHNLGSVPGCIIVKTTSNAGYNWAVYHRSLSSGDNLRLNTTDSSSGAALGPGGFGDNTNVVAPTSTVFTVGNNGNLNNSGFTYVAYLFAHNAGGFGLTGTDNVISCGSYYNSGSAPVNVNLGYEPQWILIKNADSAQNWFLMDTMRGDSLTSQAILKPNTSDAETVNAGAPGYPAPTATGFTTYLGAAGTFIYIAIRRGPMKVPTSGTSVFAPVVQNTISNPAITTNFPVDLSINTYRSPGGSKWFADRLRGGSANATSGTYVELESTSTSAEITGTGAGIGFDSNTGIYDKWIQDANPIFWNFRRAPSFFDEVCYTGDGTNGKAYNHNLTVVPELAIVKGRSSTSNWKVLYQPDMRVLTLNTTAAYESAGNTQYYFGNDTIAISPTSTQFTVSNGGSLNVSGSTYVAYLFATCAGVSKVGSVTHSEPTTVVCGFAPRFVLIKSTQDTGTNDWFVFDSARGITSGNDPYLRLNSTDAENTPFGAADLIDPTADGFIMNGFGGGNYIYLAIA